MSYRWFGAALVIAGCGGFGFSIASGYKREEGILRQLLRVLNYMEWELQYRLTPLPELCRQAGKETRGTLREVFFNLARELEWQTSPDAASCMTAALKRSHELPRRIRGIMKQLGHTLGRFDLPGQKQGLEEVKEACRMELEALGKNRETRLRSYGTLGLCAGAALAIARLASMLGYLVDLWSTSREYADGGDWPIVWESAGIWLRHDWPYYLFYLVLIVGGLLLARQLKKRGEA